MDDRAFSFLPINRREAKPRRRGLTEIRGPYYSVMGSRYLSDILETMGEYVDGVKYAGGSFALMPRKRVQELNHLAHQYEAYVSTGGSSTFSRAVVLRTLPATSARRKRSASTSSSSPPDSSPCRRKTSSRSSRR